MAELKTNFPARDRIKCWEGILLRVIIGTQRGCQKSLVGPYSYPPFPPAPVFYHKSGTSSNPRVGLVFCDCDLGHIVVLQRNMLSNHRVHFSVYLTRQCHVRKRCNHLSAHFPELIASPIFSSEVSLHFHETNQSLAQITYSGI